MSLINVDGHGLAALTVLAITVLFLVAIGARLLRPTRFRVARIGVFIERHRFEDDPVEDPPDNDATMSWPERPPD